MRRVVKKRPAADSVMQIDSVGRKLWHNKRRQYHRADGPAIECPDGYRAWYLNDKRHRADGPAIEGADGYRAWYVNGQRHRADGPAIEGADGSRSWYVAGRKMTGAEFDGWRALEEEKRKDDEGERRASDAHEGVEALRIPKDWPVKPVKRKSAGGK